MENNKQPMVWGYKITHKTTQEERYIVLWETEPESLQLRLTEELEINPADYEWFNLCGHYNPLICAIQLFAEGYADDPEADFMEFLLNHVFDSYFNDYYNRFNYSEICMMVMDARIDMAAYFTNGESWNIIQKQLLDLWNRIYNEYDYSDAYLW